jgi:hypothetical protein
MPLSDRIGSREWCNDYIRHSLLRTIADCIIERYAQESKCGSDSQEPVRLNPNIIVCPNLDTLENPHNTYMLLAPLSRMYYISNTGRLFVHLNGKYRYLSIDDLPLCRTEMYPLFRMIQDNYYPGSIYDYPICLICLVLNSFYNLTLEDRELTVLIDEQCDQVWDGLSDWIGTRVARDGSMCFYFTGEEAYATVLDALNDCADTVFLQIIDRLPRYIP